jgi:hypothetical protein
VLEMIYTKILEHFMRMRTDFGDLMSALGALVEAIGVHQLIPELEALLNKL